MQAKLIAAALAASTLSACPPRITPSGPNPFLRVENQYRGWRFTGVQFTPDVDVQLSVHDAPERCGQSFCSSGGWQPIGPVHSGPVGGIWPNVQGEFHGLISREDMARRLGYPVTCYPGENWGMNFIAKDPATGRQTAVSSGATTVEFFGGLPRCP